MNLCISSETDLELKVKQSPKHRIRTRVIVVRDFNKDFILSVEALRKLSIISPDFPAVFDYDKTGGANTITRSIYKGSDIANRRCLRRSAVPDLPLKPPCEVKEENRKKLEKFILDYFANSAFKKCKHQQLPELSGEPMHILIDQTQAKLLAAN